MTLSFGQVGHSSDSVIHTISDVSVETSVWTADQARLSVVQFEFTSNRDDTVEIRLVEDIPDGIPIEDIGPHPKYGGEKWHKTADRKVVFIDHLGPHETSFTLYGVKGLDSTQVDTLLTDPDLEVRSLRDESTSNHAHFETMTTEQSTTNGETTENEQPEAPETSDFDELIPRGSGLNGGPSGHDSADAAGDQDQADELRFVSSDVLSVDENPDDDIGRDESSSVEPEEPAQAADESTADDVADAGEKGEENEVDELGEADASEEADAPEVGESEETDSSEAGESEESPNGGSDEPDAAFLDREASNAPAEDESTDSVVAAFVAELSSSELSDEDAKLIRDSLGLSAPNSLEARLRNVRSRMDDLAVYTDALEEFIDENGTAQQLLSDLQGDTDAMRDDIAKLDETLSASMAAIEAVEAQVESLEERTVTASELEDRLDALDEKYVTESTADEELAGLAEEIETLRDDVERGKTWRRNLSQATQIPEAMEDCNEEEAAEQ